jgi:hypothetical protein
MQTKANRSMNKVIRSPTKVNRGKNALISIPTISNRPPTKANSVLIKANRLPTKANRSLFKVFGGKNSLVGIPTKLVGIQLKFGIILAETH